MKKNSIICIIDDEEINQFILKTIIKNINKEIRTLSYNNGEEALHSLTELMISIDQLPDIILLDINMPVMGGWQFMDEFVKIIPQIDKKISIYIISSSSAPDDKKKAKSYIEIEGYLTRPIEPYLLKDIFEKEEFGL
jgi:CheY-like chemotaxis protein